MIRRGRPERTRWTKPCYADCLGVRPWRAHPSTDWVEDAVSRMVKSGAIAWAVMIWRGEEMVRGVDFREVDVPGATRERGVGNVE